MFLTALTQKGKFFWFFLPFQKSQHICHKHWNESCECKISFIFRVRIFTLQRWDLCTEIDWLLHHARWEVVFVCLKSNHQGQTGKRHFILFPGLLLKKTSYFGKRFWRTQSLLFSNKKKATASFNTWSSLKKQFIPRGFQILCPMICEYILSYFIKLGNTSSVKWLIIFM